ncbi:hypothetical protein DFH09DRAFT_948827 [Mycena vulgaris]|nr:hypothetical protein DFH09DRAFT_948827 [Mycena vulgaris]
MYRAWKGKVTAEPAHFHSAIRWNTSIDGTDPQIVYGTWKPTIKKGPSASNAQSKRKAETTLQQPPPKKLNRTVFAAPTSVVASAASFTSVIVLPGPTGLIWDSTNYSCAYDSLFTTLANIWRDNPGDWTQRLVRSSALLGLWALSMTEKQDPSEHSRDAVRRILTSQNPVPFPLGPRGVKLDDLFTAMTDRRSYWSARMFCEQCNHQLTGETDTFSQFVDIAFDSVVRNAYPAGRSMNEWFGHHFNKYVSTRCVVCRANGSEVKMRRVTEVREVPDVLMLGIGMDIMLMEETLDFKHGNETTSTRLRGLIYYSQDAAHFTSVVLDNDGTMWYHDGITTRRGSVLLGKISEVRDLCTLHKIREERLCAAVYARV